MKLFFSIEIANKSCLVAECLVGSNYKTNSRPSYGCVASNESQRHVKGVDLVFHIQNFLRLNHVGEKAAISILIVKIVKIDSLYDFYIPLGLFKWREKH